LILMPDYQTRARNIADQMISPHESASRAADLVDSFAQSVQVTD
jgi:hypothetical protein